MTTTIIMRKDGQTVEHIGTSGFTITATRLDNDVEVLIEFDDASPEESIAMIGMLLVQLDEEHGENFVAQCFAHYAEETGKLRTRVGMRDVVRIRGYKDEPISKRRKFGVNNVSYYIAAMGRLIQLAIDIKALCQEKIT